MCRQIIELISCMDLQTANLTGTIYRTNIALQIQFFYLRVLITLCYWLPRRVILGTYKCTSASFLHICTALYQLLQMRNCGILQLQFCTYLYYSFLGNYNVLRLVGFFEVIKGNLEQLQSKQPIAYRH
jgi:hypothetical protein